jgi:type III restriction enzyme
MSHPFFEKPIVNSPYEYPNSHWELDETGQPTHKILNHRRKAEFITPIPTNKKKKNAKQATLDFGDTKGLSNERQVYDGTQINRIREQVSIWRELPSSQWNVTPETARLLEHWRHFEFTGVRPFFCQVEAVETIIWLT